MYEFNFLQRTVMKTFGLFSVAGIALTAFLSFLQYHDGLVRQDAMDQCNKAHIEEVNRENAETAKKVQELEALKRQLSFKTYQENTRLSEQTDRINRDIDQFSDRPASEILKRTFKDLQEIE